MHIISTHSILHQQIIFLKVWTWTLMFTLCVLQDSIIEEVRALWERRRKAGGLKEMLQDVTKLTQKLRFLVEEVWQPARLCYVFDRFVFANSFVLLPGIAHIYSCTLYMQPQHTSPDIFVWLLSNNKRIAYARLQARDLLYSSTQEARGIYCGKIITLFLKVKSPLPVEMADLIKNVSKEVGPTCAASREAGCRFISPSQTGCVFVVRKIFRFQPHAGQPASRTDSQ